MSFFHFHDFYLLDMDDKNLIGDKTKKYCLPTIKGKHQDLKGVDPETVSCAFVTNGIENITS